MIDYHFGFLLKNTVTVSNLALTQRGLFAFFQIAKSVTPVNIYPPLKRLSS